MRDYTLLQNLGEWQYIGSDVRIRIHYRLVCWMIYVLHILVTLTVLWGQTQTFTVSERRDLWVVHCWQLPPLTDEGCLYECGGYAALVITQALVNIILTYYILPPSTVWM